MDDFVLLHESKSYLDSCLIEIKKHLESIGFKVNPTKTGVFKITNGITFLGFTFNVTDTGKVIAFIGSETVKQEKRRLRGLIRRYHIGKMTKEDINKCFTCWLEHASKGNTYKVINKMKAYYHILWRRYYDEYSSYS